METQLINGNSELEYVNSFLKVLTEEKYKNMPFNELMEQIGIIYDADRSYIFEQFPEENVWKNTFEWCREGVEPQKDNLQAVPNEAVEPWIEEFKKEGSFFLENNEEYAEKVPIVAEILEPQGVECLMAAPITLQGEIVGLLGVDNPRKNTDKLFLLTIIVISMYKELIYLRQQKLLKQEIENKKALEKAIISAKSANQAKSAFLSRMSHDIRTPLNGIIGLLNLSEKHSDDKALVDSNRKKALVASDHLLSLISDVLELSKLDSSGIQLAHEPFSVDELSNDILTIVSAQAVDDGIELIKDEKDNIKPNQIVFGSPLHIRQIFINIFSNAIKYNKPYGKIYYSREEIARDDKTVTYKVTITDTGIGMSEEFQKHIFEPFAQEHYDSNSTYHGTGLGMSIVKPLVEMMNGTIEVKSKLNEGTTVTVCLPMEIAEETDIPQEFEVTETSLKDVKILVAEDNELNMEISEAILNDAGAVVTKAFNGKEAVDLFKNNKPGTFDVILMDLMMPVMDGYQATIEIRNYYREDSKTIPIIAVTANAFTEDVRKCLQSGMDAHISKPINVPQLIEAISKVTSRNKNNNLGKNM